MMTPPRRRTTWMLLGLLPALAAAQAGKLVIPDFGDLASKATQAVDITLEGDTLQSAAQLLGAASGRGSDADVSGVVRGLKAITVRSFTFDKPGMYSREAVEGVLAQVNVPGWKKVIALRDKGEHVEVHMRENAEDGGLLIVTEQAEQLTIVNVAGRINMEQLRRLQGHLGVPNLSGIVGGALPAATPLAPPPAAVVTPAPPGPSAQEAAPASPPGP